MGEKIRKASKRYGSVLDILILLILSMVGISLACNNNIWLDESLSLRWSAFPMSEMFGILVEDVHPPLHYIMLNILIKIFGCNVAAGKILAVSGFVVMILCGFVFLKKQFGRTAYYFFSLCMVSLPFMLVKIVEIRMYSWSMAFAVITGVASYYVLKEGTWKHWGLFVLGALASAYNHYYGVLTMIFLYGVVGGYFLLNKNGKQLWNFLLACFATVIGYLPWFFIAIKQITTVNGNYWIKGPFSPMAYLKELFRVEAFPHSTKIYCLVIAAFAVILLLKFIKNRNVETYWGVAVTIPFWGVMTFGILYSTYVKPVLIARYLIIPLSLLFFGSAVACRYLPKIVIGILCIFFIIMTVCTYPIAFKAEFNTNTNKTLAFIEENMTDSEVIIYNNDTLGSVTLFYEPDMLTCYYKDYDVLTKEYNNIWYFDALGYIDSIYSELQQKNITIEEYPEYGFDNVNFTIYRLTREN